MTKLRSPRSPDTNVPRDAYCRPRRHLALMGTALLAVSMGVAGCGSQATPSHPNPTTTQSPPPPSPGPTHDVTPSPDPTSDATPSPPENDAVVQADRAFWVDYTNDDAQGACSRTFGYAHGQVVSMGGAFLTECVSSLGASSPAGTSLTLGDPVVYDNVIALVPVSGQVCGAESTTVGDCSTISGLSEQMPGSASPAAFGAALTTILTNWANNSSGWTPDVLVKVDGVWHPLLNIADPVATGPTTDSPPPKQPWTEKDWNDTCASNGCGAVPGLPPFVPGGGLSFGGS